MEDIKKIAEDLSEQKIKLDLIKLFQENPNPKDEVIHAYAEKNKLDPHEVERLIYMFATKYVETLGNVGEPKQNPKLKGFVTDIESDTIENDFFRKVLYTGKNSQLVLMSLEPDEDIGDEIHDVDQFFRIDEGDGIVIINGKEYDIENGTAIVIPAGAKHNVIAGEDGLKLYSIYSPAHHADGTIHETKEDAQEDTEHFDGKTTE